MKVKNRTKRNSAYLLIIFSLMLLVSCSHKEFSRSDVQLFKEINFKKYKAVYYTVFFANGNNIAENISVANKLKYYFLKPLGFNVENTEGKFIDSTEHYEDFLNSIKTKENILFVRCEFEIGKSIPPVLKREFDGFITTQRSKTNLWLIDASQRELIAILNHERSSYDGKIPEEILYKKLISKIHVIKIGDKNK